MSSIGGPTNQPHNPHIQSNQNIPSEQAASKKLGANSETPEAKEASEIDRKANDLVQDVKNRSSTIKSEYERHRRNIPIYNDKVKKMADWGCDSGTVLNNRTRLLELSTATLTLDKEIATLESLGSQIVQKENEINSLYQSILNGNDPANNLAKIKEAYSSLESLKTSFDDLSSKFDNYIAKGNAIENDTSFIPGETG